MKTHYATLGVPPSATDEEVKLAYRAIAREQHPDRTGGEPSDLFIEAAQAYSALSTKRAEYDRWLKMCTKQCERCDGNGTVRKQKSFTTVEKLKCEACGGTGQADRT